MCWDTRCWDSCAGTFQPPSWGDTQPGVINSLPHPSAYLEAINSATSVSREVPQPCCPKPPVRLKESGTAHLNAFVAVGTNCTSLAGPMDAAAERDHYCAVATPRVLKIETDGKENVATYRSELNLFTGKHRRKRVYKCHLCPYTSCSASDVRKHVRIHTGERPFKCSLCSYASTQRQNARIHMVKHSVERPFLCRICGTAYKRKQDLQRHTEALHN